VAVNAPLRAAAPGAAPGVVELAYEIRAWTRDESRTVYGKVL
jgi:hypothetical protein